MKFAKVHIIYIFHMMIIRCAASRYFSAKYDIPEQHNSGTSFVSALDAQPSHTGAISFMPEFLHLRNSNLLWFDDSAYKEKYVTFINLESNAISEISESIGGFIKLVYLNVSDNCLTTIPKEIGQLASLNVLKLANNNLRYLPSEIGLLANLKTLDLADNKLTALPWSIKNLKDSLTVLDLRGNDIVEYSLDNNTLGREELLEIFGSAVLFDTKHYNTMTFNHDKIILAKNQTTQPYTRDAALEILSEVCDDLGLGGYLEQLSRDYRDEIGAAYAHVYSNMRMGDVILALSTSVRSGNDTNVSRKTNTKHERMEHLLTKAIRIQRMKNFVTKFIYMLYSNDTRDITISGSSREVIKMHADQVIYILMELKDDEEMETYTNSMLKLLAEVPYKVICAMQLRKHIRSCTTTNDEKIFCIIDILIRQLKAVKLREMTRKYNLSYSDYGKYVFDTPELQSKLTAEMKCKLDEYRRRCDLRYLCNRIKYFINNEPLFVSYVTSYLQSPGDEIKRSYYNYFVKTEDDNSRCVTDNLVLHLLLQSGYINELKE